MAGRKYRDSYFQSPGLLESALGTFRDTLAQELRSVLSTDAAGQEVVAVQGVASLFGFVRVSELIAATESDIRGRLLIFFPGEYADNNYRLLDARDGWNYLAIPITAYTSEANSP